MTMYATDTTQCEEVGQKSGFQDIGSFKESNTAHCLTCNV
jgi:hypothetical protein